MELNETNEIWGFDPQGVFRTHLIANKNGSCFPCPDKWIEGPGDSEDLNMENKGIKEIHVIYNDRGKSKVTKLDDVNTLVSSNTKSRKTISDDELVLNI